MTILPDRWPYGAYEQRSPFDVIIFRKGGRYRAVYTHDNNGNAVTPSSTAQTVLQAAFNLGGSLFIKDGTYPTTSQLTLPSNTRLVCESWNTLIQGAGSHVMLTNADASNSDIEVQGGTWDANNGTSTDGGIYFNNTDNVYIHGTKVINSSAEGIKVRNGDYSRIIGNYVYKSALVNGNEARAGIISANGSGKTTIDGNTVIDSYGECIGVYYATGSQVSICGNTGTITTNADSPIRRGHILVEADDGASESQEIAICGNSVISNYYGLNLLSAKNVTATGNTFRAYGDGTGSLNALNINGACNNIVVTGNKFYNYGNNGCLIKDTSQRITIVGNSFVDMGQAATNTYMGLYMQPRGGNIRDVVFNSNVIMSNSTAKIENPLYIDTSTNTITKLVFAHNEVAGNHGVPIGYSLSTTGAFTFCQFSDNEGMQPLGNISNPFNDTDSEIGIQTHGSSSTYAATPTSGTVYTAYTTDLLITSVGGTVSAINITGPSANEIAPNGGAAITTLAAFLLPREYAIKWTHTGAPTVKVHAL